MSSFISSLPATKGEPINFNVSFTLFSRLGNGGLTAAGHGAAQGLLVAWGVAALCRAGMTPLLLRPKREISMRRVRHVDRVEAHAVAGPPGTKRRLLSVAAIGLAPTTGWRSPRLAPRAHATPPSDGVWDFDLLATPPRGAVLEVIRPLTAEWLGRHPDWCKGVRIHGAANQIAAALGESLPGVAASMSSVLQAVLGPSPERAAAAGPSDPSGRLIRVRHPKPQA